MDAQERKRRAFAGMKNIAYIIMLPVLKKKKRSGIIIDLSTLTKRKFIHIPLLRFNGLNNCKTQSLWQQTKIEQIVLENNKD